MQESSDTSKQSVPTQRLDKGTFEWMPQTEQSTIELTHTISDYVSKRDSGTKKAEYSDIAEDSYGNRWRLIIYVNGNGRASNHHLSLFLQVADVEDLPFGWKKSVSYVLSLEHPSEDNKSYSKRNPDKTFKLCPKAIDWGWSQFITSDRIQQDGFVLDDSLVVKAVVTVKSSAVSIDEEDAELYLKCAVEDGDSDAIHLCLEHGAQINCQFKDDLYTPLHTACSTGTNAMKVLRYLLEKDADVNACNKWNETPLLIAANNGHEEAVGALLEFGADPSLCSEAGWSALTFAAHKGFADIVDLLINAGAPVNCTVTEDFSTPLHKACAGTKGGHAEAVKLLLEAGADVHALNKWRETPLLTAANHGQTDSVGYLLEHEADPCRCTDTGWSPLSIAAYKGHDEVVELLLDEGDAPTEEIDPTLSALLQAATKGLPSTVEILLEHGADVSVTTKKGDTALSLLVEQNLIDTAVEMVTKYNASIPKCSRDRRKVQKARLLINHRLKQLEKEQLMNALHHSGESDEEVELNQAQHANDQGSKNKKKKKKKLSAEEEAKAAEEALLLELEAEETKAKRTEVAANNKKAKKQRKKQREREQKEREEQLKKEQSEREAAEVAEKKRQEQERSELERQQQKLEAASAAEQVPPLQTVSSATTPKKSGKNAKKAAKKTQLNGDQSRSPTPNATPKQDARSQSSATPTNGVAPSPLEALFAPLRVEHPAISLFRREKMGELLRQCFAVAPTVPQHVIKRVIYRWIVRATHSKTPYHDGLLPSWIERDSLVAFFQRQLISEALRGQRNSSAKVDMESLKDTGSKVAAICSTCAEEMLNFRMSIDAQLPQQWSDSDVGMTESPGDDGSRLMNITWSNRGRVQVAADTLAALRASYTGPPEKVLTAVFFAKTWYETFSFVMTDTTLDFHVPLRTMEALASDAGVSMLLWSDPFHASRSIGFCGQFDSIDGLFGGNAPWGKDSLAKDIFEGGGSSAFVFPPFDSMLSSRYVQHVVDALERANASGTALTFFVLLHSDSFHDLDAGPKSGDDIASLDSRLRSKSSVLVHTRVLPANEHHFVTSGNDPVMKACSTSSMFALLQSTAAQNAAPVGDAVFSKIAESMIIHPLFPASSDTSLVSSLSFGTGFAASSPVTQRTLFGGPAVAVPSQGYTSVSATPNRTINPPIQTAADNMVSPFSPSLDNGGRRRGRLFDLVDDVEEDPGHDLVSGMLNNLDMGSIFQAPNASSDVDIEAISLMGIGGGPQTQHSPIHRAGSHHSAPFR